MLTLVFLAVRSLTVSAYKNPITLAPSTTHFPFLRRLAISVTLIQMLEHASLFPHLDTLSIMIIGFDAPEASFIESSALNSQIRTLQLVYFRYDFTFPPIFFRSFKNLQHLSVYDPLDLLSSLDLIPATLKTLQFITKNCFYDVQTELFAELTRLRGKCVSQLSQILIYGIKKPQFGELVECIEIEGRKVPVEWSNTSYTIYWCEELRLLDHFEVSCSIIFTTLLYTC